MNPFVIFIHKTGAPLSPEMATAEGLTGAEEVLCFLSRELARVGYRVAVCVDNTGGRPDRIAEGIRWVPWSYLGEHVHNDPTGENTVLVLSMYPNLIYDTARFTPLRARRKIMWLHSIGHDNVQSSTWRLFDEIVCATRWQAETLRERYAASVSIRTIPYGLPDPSPWAETKKTADKMIYSSSPDRGLLRLLRWWPEIKRSMPDASLVVTYGRSRIRKELAEDLAEAFAACNGLAVTDAGFLPYKEFMGHLAESAFWLYPTDFEETGCLAGRKAVALGAIPIFTDAGCLAEVLAPYPPCWKPDGAHPLDSEAAAEAFVSAIQGSRFGRILAPPLGWDKVVERWHQVLKPACP